MKRLALVVPLLACADLTHAPIAPAVAPPISAPPSASTTNDSTSEHLRLRLVPARDGGMTCLSATDVRRLQEQLARRCE